MTNTIHLAGALTREGKVMLVRSSATSSWELPGGPLLPRHEEAEAGMKEILSGYGISVPSIEDDFVETVYLPGDEGQIVYNLYIPGEWEGDPEIPIGIEARWTAFEELESVEMDPLVRSALLVAVGLIQPPDQTSAIMSALQGTLEEAAGGSDGGVQASTGWERPGQSAAVTRPTRDNGADDRNANAPTVAPLRRQAGLDVLRTLGATEDPEGAVRAMEQRQPEIAGDVIDFALGEVWSNPALDRKTRSLQVVAMLSALGGKNGPLRAHINGALNHGATPEQVVQTLRMVAVYAGFPAALEAWPLMEEVFRARGIRAAGEAFAMKALLWDLDDTLLNTLPARMRALSQAYEACLGCRTDPLALWRSHRGGTLEDLGRRLLGDDYRRFTTIYRDRYYGSLRSICCYEGVIPTLEACSEAAFPMAVVTSKVSWGATEELEDAGILSYFAAVVGFDDTERHKPDPEPIFAALDRLMVDDCKEAVFIGDSPADIFAARNAGCVSVAATWGTLDAELLLDCAPDHTVATPVELASLLRSLRESRQ